MNCRETRPLLPLFVDGELDARQMRGIALHSTRCAECEEELRQVERVQDLVSQHIHSQVEEMDLSQIWLAVAPRIAQSSPTIWLRARDWWESFEAGWLIKAPVYAALAVALIVALMVLRPTNPTAREPVEIADNSAIFDTVDSHIDNVALLNDPETNTSVLWISDEIPADAGSAGDVP